MSPTVGLNLAVFESKGKLLPCIKLIMPTLGSWSSLSHSSSISSGKRK